ncbi:hypothetical protein ACFOOK_32175 [Micromonospora krabiensis]|uniref:Class I SAM-dependent methyltransferase n=1 Tax=Micromonospora krabiensis TaxID=307121 RepID=A0A1C3MYE7_9ACTN|nr:hypothetical protein [Micromonospora krabiensis]SBV25357.1 hypothetical protein GA0070620_0831 [Micromonospora krabiensis]
MNLRLTGGEMPLWSDLDGRHGPGPVHGPVLAPLLAGASGRTLVLGPLDPALLDAVPADDLTVLVRGLADAEVLAARLAGRPGAGVLCGGPERLATEPAYDTVIALDGLERLRSTEGADLTWYETLTLLVATLRPGGALLLAVENHLGLHRLVAAPTAVTDSEWATVGEYDPDRPAGLARLRARLTDAGLRLTDAHTAWPSPLAPTVLLAPGLLADPEVVGFLQATLGRACAGWPEALTDPGRLAATAVRHGAATELAPAWILRAERATLGWGGSDHTAGDAAEPGHRVGASPSGPERGAGRPVGLVALGDDRFDVVDGAGRPLVRRADGTTTPVPTGRTVEDLLIGAALRHDLPTVRELLHRWQAGRHAGVPVDQLVATPGGGLAPLVPALPPGVALRHLAVRLIDAGLAHLWPSPADPVELALTLAALAGSAFEPVPPTGDAPTRVETPSYRELLATRDRLARELGEAREREEWYERTLAAREGELRRAREIVALLSGTPTARAGKLVLAGARRARRTAGAAVRRVLPRD